MEPLVFDHKEVQRLLPHRYPFLLVDRIENVILGKRAKGIKNVSGNEGFFQGHFPGYPIMPGVLIIEALAQTAGALVTKTMEVGGKISLSQESKNLVYFMSIESAKFRKPVVPGDVLELHVEITRNRGTVWKFEGKAWVRGQLTDEACFTAMIADSN